MSNILGGIFLNSIFLQDISIILACLLVILFVVIPPLINFAQNNEKEKIYRTYKPNNLQSQKEDEKVLKMVTEWEDIGFCAPKYILKSNAHSMCKKFKHDCHRCLLNYATMHPEQTELTQLYLYNSEKSKEV